MRGQPLTRQSKADVLVTPGRSRTASFELPAAARTAPMCCAQTNVVVKQPDASVSPTSQTVVKAASIPPLEAGPADLIRRLVDRGERHP